MEELTLKGHKTVDLTLPEQSDWKCYLFGSGLNDANSFTWTPQEGFKIPNFFIRWMMKTCLGCTWVKKDFLKGE